MTTTRLLDDPGGPRLQITFPGWERFMVRRASFEVPASAVTAVRVHPGWSHEVLGLRSGMVVSGVMKIATFRHFDGTRRLVAMRRGLELLRVSLQHPTFDEILVSTPEAAAIAHELNTAVRS